jgi:hypothetical protein
LFVFTSPLIDDEPLVNAAGFVAQSVFAAAVLVTPLMVMSHVAAPALIVPAATFIVDGASSVTVAEQPVPLTVAEAPVVNRKPEGRVSTNAMPDCGGLPVALVSRKFRGATPPARIELVAKLFVNVGAGGGVTIRH